MDISEVSDFFKGALKYIAILTVLIILFVYIIGVRLVRGDAMNPILKDGDVVFVSKISTEIKRGDIIDFKDSDGNNNFRRVIGLSLEEIHFRDNTLYINGKAYEENYLDSNIKTTDFSFIDICSTLECENGVIPKDMYLVLSDNRDDLLDSRTSIIGLVSKKSITGKYMFKILPFG